MTLTYYITMSDGSSCKKQTGSAGEALFWALNRKEGRGLTVKEIFAGPPTGSARTTYDIPPHKAIPPDPEPAKDEKKEVSP
jgi:hypothetical protein